MSVIKMQFHYKNIASELTKYHDYGPCTDSRYTISG